MTNHKVAILTPTFNRPSKIKPYIENIKSVTDMSLVDIVFIVEDDDVIVKNKCLNSDAITIINKRKRSYAGAINTAVRELDYDYYFASADDCYFYNNWLPPILELSKNYGVVGTNDLGNPSVLNKQHATHYLVSKRYLNKCVFDSPNDMLHEGYLHNFTDTELVQNAISNKEFIPCLHSIVEHLHYSFGKSDFDETYKKQDGTSNHDIALYNARKINWENK